LDELGENIGERRVFNAIRAQQIAITRKRPGRGSVGGNPHRAIKASQIDVVRKHIEGTMPVSKIDAVWIISSLQRAGMKPFQIAEHCGATIDEPTISNWLSGRRRMKYKYFAMLDELLERMG
jgi:hypothetical protein